MIKYAKYPEDLPLPSSNFNGTYKTPTVTTGFTSGKIRRRKIGRTSIKSATLEWLFTPDEFDLWESFYRIELEASIIDILGETLIDPSYRSSGLAHRTL